MIQNSVTIIILQISKCSNTNYELIIILAAEDMTRFQHHEMSAFFFQFTISGLFDIRPIFIIIYDFPTQFMLSCGLEFAMAIVLESFPLWNIRVSNSCSMQQMERIGLGVKLLPPPQDGTFLEISVIHVQNCGKVFNVLFHSLFNPIAMVVV